MNLGCQIEKADSIERGLRALDKAKKLEEKNLSSGHRYMHITDRTQILVECDSNGEPTERGQRQIEAAKRALV